MVETRIDYFINIFSASCKHSSCSPVSWSFSSTCWESRRRPKQVTPSSDKRNKADEAAKFNLKMKEAISCVTMAPGGRLELDCVCVLGSQRSDAGMHHLLDNPICPVINNTHYWRRDGSSVIKASTSLPRVLLETHNRPEYQQAYF